MLTKEEYLTKIILSCHIIFINFGCILMVVDAVVDDENIKKIEYHIVLR